MGGLKMETRAIRIPLNIAVLYLASERNRVFPLDCLDRGAVHPIAENGRTLATSPECELVRHPPLQRLHDRVAEKGGCITDPRALDSRSFAHGRVEAICLGKHLEQSDKIEWR